MSAASKIRPAAVGYVRVSTSGQAIDGVSLAAQLSKIRAYCDLNELELVAVYEDAGLSASTMNRPGLAAAMKLLRAGKATALVCYSLSRVTRDLGDLAEILEAFARADISLHSVSERLDTASAAGRLVLNVLGAVAQWEREAIGERTTAALWHKAQQSERTGTVPYGWELAADGVHLVPVTAEQAGLARARELRADGQSFRAIAAALDSEGFAAKSGGTWQHTAVRSILRRQSKHAAAQVQA